MIPHDIEHKSRQDLLLDSLKLENFHYPFKNYIYQVIFTFSYL